MSDKFDIDALRRDNTLSAYLPSRGVKLERSGREFKSCCPLHAETSPSFTVFTGRRGHQLFRCFGCDQSGDIVDFVQAFDGVDFAEACRILGGERSPPEDRPVRQPVEAGPDPYADWRAILPPADAPPIIAGQRTPPLFNPKSDERPVTSYTPAAVHPYRTIKGAVYAYVLRVEIDGKKITPCIAWCRNEKTGQVGWCHYTLQAPRRLYGLDQVAARPNAPVIVVEGEKCADALAIEMPDHVVVTWSGGGKAAGKTDWAPLAGRSVTIWPDRDEAGMQAVEGWNGKPGLLDLIPAKARVARPDAIERTKGWDCADAIADGWTGEDCLRWLNEQTGSDQLNPRAQEKPDMGIPVTEQSQRVTPPKPRSIPETNVVAIHGGNVGGTGFDWRAELRFDKHGQPEKKNPHNWFNFLRYHPEFEGMFCKNTFTGMIMVNRKPEWDTAPTWTARPLSDNDVTRCAMTLGDYRFGELEAADLPLGRVISSVAEVNAFNPVADFMRGLVWDKIPRLYGGPKQDGWLCHYFGAQSNTYHRTVGMRWMISGVARALTEGTIAEKVDTMLILEGPQGFYKSTALEILATLNGHVMYTDSMETFSGKDASMQTNGVLIVEIGELNGMSARNVDVVKKWMTTKVDRYRPPYGRNVVEVPRRFITAGTVNPSGTGYLHDATGARRFWPVLCGHACDLEALRRDRDQLWAEAVHLFLSGEQWWLRDDEQPDAAYQQGLRYHDDPWAGRLDAMMRDAVEISLSDAFDAISMPLHRASNEDKKRIADHMKARGWGSVRDNRGERWQKFR